MEPGAIACSPERNARFCNGTRSYYTPSCNTMVCNGTCSHGCNATQKWISKYIRWISKCVVMLLVELALLALITPMVIYHWVCDARMTYTPIQAQVSGRSCSTVDCSRFVVVHNTVTRIMIDVTNSKKSRNLRDISATDLVFLCQLYIQFSQLAL